MQTFTTDVARVSEEYVDPVSGQSRVAVITSRATAEGFETSLRVFSRTDDGDLQFSESITLSSPDPYRATVDMGSLRHRAGVPDTDPMGIADVSDRAKAAPDRIPGPQPERRASETPAKRDAPAAPGGERPTGSPNEDRALDPGDTRGDDFGPETSRRADGRSEGEGFRSPGAALADQWDEQVSQANRASDTLRGQLEQYVDEGGSWLLGALGTTALDVAGHAMKFTQGLADTARIGQGVSQGTWAGVKEDAGRLLNVLPQGRIAKAIGVGLGVSDTVEAAAQSDAKGGALAALGVLAATVTTKPSGKKKGGKKNSSNQKATSKPRSPSASWRARRSRKFTAYEDLPPKTGYHRHHIALAGIFRRARSKRLRELEQRIGSEYLSDEAIAKGGVHHTLHRITNAALKAAGLFPGGKYKQTYTRAEVERAIRVLIDTYRTENVGWIRANRWNRGTRSAYADYLEDLLAALKKDGFL